MSTDGAIDFPAGTFLYWCEWCGREDLLDSRDTYDAGWDFPPHMGAWGVISPRTCPNCSIQDTAWWAITVHHRGIDEMTAQQRKAVCRREGEYATIRSQPAALRNRLRSDLHIPLASSARPA